VESVQGHRKRGGSRMSGQIKKRRVGAYCGRRSIRFGHVVQSFVDNACFGRPNQTARLERQRPSANLPE
jgi:hypothetical protein